MDRNYILFSHTKFVLSPHIVDAEKELTDVITN